MQLTLCWLSSCHFQISYLSYGSLFLQYYHYSHFFLHVATFHINLSDVGGNPNALQQLGHFFLSAQQYFSARPSLCTCLKAFASSLYVELLPLSLHAFSTSNAFCPGSMHRRLNLIPSIVDWFTPRWVPSDSQHGMISLDKSFTTCTVATLLGSFIFCLLAGGASVKESLSIYNMKCFWQTDVQSNTILHCKKQKEFTR